MRLIRVFLSLDKVKWTHNPRPNHLPEDRRPPFPPTAQVSQLLRQRIALDLRPGQAIRRVVLLASKPHANSQKDLAAPVSGKST